MTVLRSSYVTAPANFALASILRDGSKDGQYHAVITRNTAAFTADGFALALVLNTNTNSVANPVLVSSSPFVLKKQTSNITIVTQPASSTSVTEGSITEILTIAATVSDGSTPTCQ
jgi:hypothetical protein